MSTRVLTYLSVLLVVFFQASSAPVYMEGEPRPSKSFETLPIFKETVEKIQAEYSQGVSKTDGFVSNFSCAACRYAIKLLQNMFDHEMSFDLIAEAVGEVCYVMKIQDKTVCNGIAQTFKVSSPCHLDHNSPH